ncbi:MAG: helix-turn-helix transcriptional regulator [Kangiellaceae bacterium]
MFIIFAVWPHKRLRSINYLLVLVIVAMSFNLLEELNITREYYLITPIFLLAKGPAFFLFVQKLIYRQPIIDRSALLHFVPMLLAIPFTQWPQMVIAVGTISQLIYAALTYSLIKRYHVASYATQSNAFSLSINWILVILAGFLVTEVIDLIRLNSQPYISLESNLIGQLVMSLISFLLLALLALRLLHQAEFFRGLSEFEESQVNNTNTELTDQKVIEQSEPSDSLIDDLESEQLIFDELKKVLLAEKLYAIPRLSLTDVSKATSFLERDISRAINLVGKTNFCEFINQLRVDSVIKQLPLTDKTILEVALESGFNSKSSFNAAFKRATSMTPSQFIKNNT